jgi:hypothetical protein
VGRGVDGDTGVILSDSPEGDRIIMKRKWLLIIALTLALVGTSVGYAVTYTSAAVTVDAASGGALATSTASATQPDWSSILTPGTADTEILRPTAAGDETNISNQLPSSGAHWEKVDDVTPDGDSTVVYTGSSGWEEDLYNIADHSTGSGTITSVKVYIECRSDAAPTQTSAYVHIKTNGVEDNGDEETVTTSYATYLYERNKNPQTNAAWTWDEIDALQIGVGLRQPTSGQLSGCTQVYVEVTYGEPALMGEVPTGTLFDITPNALYTGDLTAKIYLTNTGDLVKAYDYLNMKVYVDGSLEADETPDYQLLTLQNGEVNFNLQDIAAAEASWTQTSQSDFQGGTLNQVVTTSSPDDVILDTFTDSVTDTYDDETRIAFKSNLVVSGGQVKLTTSGGGGTEILRPNTSGDETNIASVSGATNHWEAVDEEVADDLSTYVYTSATNYERDLYNITDHSEGSGAISSITVYARCYWSGGQSPNQASIKIAIKSGTGGGAPDTVDEDEEETLAARRVWENFSSEWTVNPATGSAWTWDEIDNLQIGIALRESVSGGPANTCCTQVYVEVNYTGVYDSPGTLTSTNLLSGETVISIDSFDYNASAIPSGTSLKVQFSPDNTNWYDSSGTPDGWDTLSQGIHNIDLSGLSWSGSNLYYKMEFTSDGPATPVLDEISVNFTAYYTSGDLTSSAYDTGYEVEWGTISFTIDEPSGTNIQFQIRTAATEGELSSATWYGPTGTGDYYTTSDTEINSVHDSDRWIQYKAYFSGPGDSTPTLSDVTITYAAAAVVFTVEVTGGAHCLVSTEPSEWEAGWTITPEFYCQVTQR